MKRRLGRIAIALSALGFAGLLIAWSGLYDVGASAGHWPPVRWFLEFAMKNSIETHASSIAPPPLDAAALVERGAGHYLGGCAPCHGAPGDLRSPVVRHMLPPPPYLPDAVRQWSTAQLFWIVKHGIKYTGMPSWPAPARDDEVWSVVAFLERLPRLAPAAYRHLAYGEPIAGLAQDESRRFLAIAGPLGKAIAACARCHGLHGDGRPSGAFPRLTGQTEAYLYAALKSYADGLRPSGIMQPVASELSDREMRELAAHYAGAAHSSPAPPPAADPGLLALGRSLVENGAPGQGIPPCRVCHGPSAQPRNPLFPALAAQYPEYLAQQLRLWKAGARGDTPYSRIMEAVARRMSAEQIEAVAVYYASLRAQPEGGHDGR